MKETLWLVGLTALFFGLLAFMNYGNGKAYNDPTGQSRATAK